MFKFFRRRQREEEEQEQKHNTYAPLIQEETQGKKPTSSQVSRKHYAVERCEEMIDAARELEEQKAEYQLVSSYLNDIQILEGVDKEKRQVITETARQIINLDEARNQYLNKEHRISDMQYALFLEEESEMPGIIRRFQSNEAYLETICKDLKLLEGEKVEWEMLKEEQQEKQKNLRRISYGFLVLMVLVVFFLGFLYFAMEMDTQLYMLLTAFAAVVFASFVLIKYQDSIRDVRRSEVNRNQAITLENRVKIKYVNMKNAVDYSCAKYGVKSAAELLYNYEQYQEMVKERQRFRQTSDDLIYYSDKLIGLMESCRMYDARVWLHYTKALIDPKEMVELKHNMLVRRQHIRSQIERQIALITEMREEIAGYVYESGGGMQQVSQLLARIDAMQLSKL